MIHNFDTREETMRIFKILAAGCLAMGLNACVITSSNEIDKAAALSPKGGTFTKTLHSEYIKLAKREAKELSLIHISEPTRPY